MSDASSVQDKVDAVPQPTYLGSEVTAVGPEEDMWSNFLVPDIVNSPDFLWGSIASVGAHGWPKSLTPLCSMTVDGSGPDYAINIGDLQKSPINSLSDVNDITIEEGQRSSQQGLVVNYSQRLSIY